MVTDLTCTDRVVARDGFDLCFNLSRHVITNYTLATLSKTHTERRCYGSWAIAMGIRSRILHGMIPMHQV